tara:strand:- start:12 stop:788 length:777 start_codon:yes stop_codon:yes gene_type:complete
MKVSKIKMAILGACMAPLMPSLAIAEEVKEAASEFSISGNVGLFSDYIFRGYTQTKHQAALQGGFDLEHSSGLYAGVWASNVSWTTQSGVMSDNSAEIDFYGGYATELAGVGVDVGLLQYYYPGDYVNGSKVDSDATEFYVGVSKDIGAVSASVTAYTVLTDEAWQFGDMKGETYVTLDVDVPVNDKLTISGHIGHQTFGGTTDYDYTDWKANAEYAINDTFAAGVYYTDTNMNQTNWTVASEFLGESTVGLYLAAGF